MIEYLNIDTGESAVAVLTLAPFLYKQKRRVLVGDREAMATLPRAIRLKLRDFLDDEFTKPRYYSAGVDYVDVLTAMGKSSEPDHAEHVMADFGDDFELATAYIARCSAAVDYLRTNANAKPRTNMVGQELIEPGDFEAGEFLRAHAIVNEPMLLLDSVLSGCLTTIEVMALKEVFPSLYDAITKTLYELIVERVTKKASYQPGYRRDGIIGILLGIDLMSPQLNAMIQDSLKEAGAPAKPSSRVPQTGKPGGLAPPSERLLTNLRGT